MEQAPAIGEPAYLSTVDTRSGSAADDAQDEADMQFCAIDDNSPLSGDSNYSDEIANNSNYNGEVTSPSIFNNGPLNRGRYYHNEVTNRTEDVDRLSKDIGYASEPANGIDKHCDDMNFSSDIDLSDSSPSGSGTSGKMKILEKITSKLNISIEEYYDYRNLLSYTTIDCGDAKTLQWRHVLYETVLELTRINNNTIRIDSLKDQHKGVEYQSGDMDSQPNNIEHQCLTDLDFDSGSAPEVEFPHPDLSLPGQLEDIERVFDDLSNHLLNLFASLLSPLTKEVRHKRKCYKVKRELSYLYDKINSEDTSYKAKRRYENRSNLLLFRLGELSSRTASFTTNDVMKSAEDANWPSHIIDRVKTRLDLQKKKTS